MRKVTMRNLRPPNDANLLDDDYLKANEIEVSNELDDENNESLNDLLKRLTEFIRENLSTKVDAASQKKSLNILVVTHSCVAKEFMNAFRKLQDPKIKLDPKAEEAGLPGAKQKPA